MTIRDYIVSFVDPGFPDNAPLPFPVSEKSAKKNDVLTAYGHIEAKGYFIKQGIVEISMNNDGNEKILEFFFAGHFTCAYTSFLTQRPSDVQLTCLTDCVFQVFERNHLIEAYSHSLLANRLGRHVTEQIFLMRTKREKEFLTISAEERYLNLMKERPDILSVIPVNKIAKYLGVHPESLSRIRKHIS
jgi:CRP/FNR family transcriptional regulator, anaerobic regulatory protein